MASNPVNPLTWNVAIVDPSTGFPTPEFQRKWQQQAGANSSIPSITIPAKMVMANLLAQKSDAVGVSLTALLDVLLGNTPGSVILRGASAWTPSTITAAIDATLGNTPSGLLVRGASAWSVLAPGANGTKLTIVSGAPAWV